MQINPTDFPDYEFRDDGVYRIVASKHGRATIGRVEPSISGHRKFYRLYDYKAKQRYVPAKAIEQASNVTIFYCSFDNLKPISEFPDYATDGDNVYRVSGIKRQLSSPKLIKCYWRGNRFQYNLRKYDGTFGWIDKSLVVFAS